MSKPLRFLCVVLLLLTGMNAFAQRSANGKKMKPYREPHRPQLHFSPKANWMNDPNGMVFFEDEYHLFYQYYPDSNVWGPMHWGHAVSKDLMHWQHLPIALYPDSLGYIFSGSAVVDWKNSSGFGKNGKPPLVAMFTYHNMAHEKAGRKDFQYQGIAYSNDNGRSWTKYSGNPVIPNKDKIQDFRDPKVIWDEASRQWVMVFAAFDHVKIWTSPDLKNWIHRSDFGKESGAHGGIWECPDLLPMKTEDGTEKWVLLVSINPGAPNGGSGTQYFVGDFDGVSFRPDPAFAADTPKGRGVWLDYGRDNYAGVTWSDLPAAQNRRVFMGWMSNWDYAQVVPTTVWRSAMTLPRTLSLHKTTKGYRVFSNPVEETRLLSKTFKRLKPQTIVKSIALPQAKGLMQLDLTFSDISIDADFGIALSNEKGERYVIGFDAAKGHYYSDRSKAGAHDFSEKFAQKIHIAPRLSQEGVLKMQLFIDAAAVEMFADGGSTVMTELFFPSSPFTKVELFLNKGVLKLSDGVVWPLESIWKK
ncbi:MAG: glycoside hydrolase family 32 protein [Chitinophagales bacterium]|nr:glycoside hydrolase family 32 protein [Chitinophagales bacterium]